MFGDHIAAAARQFERTRSVVERQQQVVAKLKALGQDTAHSERVLALFKRNLAIFEKNLSALLQEERRTTKPEP